MTDNAVLAAVLVALGQLRATTDPDQAVTFGPEEAVILHLIAACALNFANQINT